jgi:serine/threonine protein kinase
MKRTRPKKSVHPAKIHAAEIKLEGLFELLRRPVMNMPVSQMNSSRRRFHSLRLLASGGLGDVFVAFDEELQREVALKVIQERHANNPQARLRFIREAEITGKLEHPGIVPVYRLGQFSDGRPFYVMRLVRGQSFQEAIESFHYPLTEKRFGLRRLLRRFLDVCDTVAYAHSRGILHRDLKPENIMLGQYGGTLVLDWGLGKPFDKPVDDPTRGSQSPIRPRLVKNECSPLNAVLGTPYYMSPEQAAARNDLVGPASDVYGLGATLYCLLTGKAPFIERSLEIVLPKVQIGDFDPPERLNPSVPFGLAAICKKAMMLSPEHRYGTVRALADDIERWLVSEPTSNHKQVPTSPKVEKVEMREQAPGAAMVVRSESGSSVPGWRVWMVGLLVLVILTTLITASVSKNPQTRAMYGGFFYLSSILLFLCFVPAMARSQKEKERRFVAQFGLPKRPNFMREWLLLNIIALPALTLLTIADKRARLDVGGVLLAWLIFLPVTVVLPLGRLLRWRRLARIQGTIHSGNGTVPH